MKKIFFITVMVILCFSVFAKDDTVLNVDKKLEKINNEIDVSLDKISTQLLEEEKQKEKAKAVDMVKSLSNAENIALMVVEKIEVFMANFEDVMVSSFSRRDTSSNISTVDRHSFIGNVLKLISGIFLIITSLYYVAKMYIDEKFQVSEFPLLFLKFALIVIIWYAVPSIAFFTKKFMWNLAELVVNGKITGMMNYTTAIRGLDTASMISIIMLGITALFSSFVIISAFGSGVSFTSLGQLFPISFGLAFTGLMATTSATIMYCTWVMEFYIALYVLVLYLPACLFKGFDYKMMSVFKFFFINGLEVFVGGCIILLVCKLYNVSLFKVGNNFSDIWGSIIQFFIKPLLIVILLPLTSKIVNAIATGGGVAENNMGTSQIINRGISQGLGGATVIGMGQALSKTSGAIGSKIGENVKLKQDVDNYNKMTGSNMSVKQAKQNKRNNDYARNFV